LLGYAIGLPASIAFELIMRSCYALKDAFTPLLIDLLALAARFGLILLFLKVMAGPYVIMTIPLAISVSATAQTMLLGTMLFVRLRKKIKMDKGLERLKRMRTRSLLEQAAQKLDEPEMVEAHFKNM
jgi:peptidoglycan biosynthesis protein MviN/MurJ (putative lipid II flippase)